MDKLSHIDNTGKAGMVDVSGKVSQKRTARAAGRINLAAATLEVIKADSLKKGDVLAVARLAGIQAAKQCPFLIPLCHPLMLDQIEVDMQMDDRGIVVNSKVVCRGSTGVEMEALTAVSLALLTVYDMCKAVDKEMVISEIKLIEKLKQDL